MLAAAPVALASLTLALPTAAGPLSFRVVARGLGPAVGAVVAPGEPARLYVPRQDGLVLVVERGRPLRRFLDLRGQVSYPNHNGGQLQLDRDGRLYVGMGDGGSGGDPHGFGQRTTGRLSKPLRTFPDRRPLRWEAVAYGLRNPWRFSFDRETGDLWIGDAGQNAWEEIDFRPAAQIGRLANSGWSAYEGPAPFEPDRRNGHGALVPPLHAYPHGEGACSVTGGYVYRAGRAGRARPLRLRRRLQRRALEPAPVARVGTLQRRVPR